MLIKIMSACGWAGDSNRSVRCSRVVDCCVLPLIDLYYIHILHFQHGTCELLMIPPYLNVSTGRNIPPTTTRPSYRTGPMVLCVDGVSQHGRRYAATPSKHMIHGHTPTARLRCGRENMEWSFSMTRPAGNSATTR